MSRIGRLHAALSYLRTLQGASDIVEYAELRWKALRHAADTEPRAIRLRSLGGATMLCRPGQDVWTFKYTFLEPFHRPPVPLRPDAVIVDLGANVGYTVADLAYRHPAARVLGVEMDAENLALARRNTAWLGPRVELVHAAVWSIDGEVDYEGDAADAFHVVAGGAVSGGAVAGDRVAGKAQHVRAVCMDTLLAEHGIERVDYLKMDIEGAEATILAGSCEWLDRVQAAKIEIHPPATLEGCRAVLEAHGLRCSVDPDHWSCLVAVRDRSDSLFGASG